MKTNLTPTSPPNSTTNKKAWDASIQVSSVAKHEEINEISRRKVATIEVQGTRTDDHMVVFREKCIQQSSRKCFLQYAAYDDVSK